MCVDRSTSVKCQQSTSTKSCRRIEHTNLQQRVVSCCKDKTPLEVQGPSMPIASRSLHESEGPSSHLPTHVTFYRSSVPKQRLRTTLRRLTFSSILATLSSTRPPASDREGAGPVSFFLPKTLFMVCYLALPLLLAPGRAELLRSVEKLKDMEGGPQIAAARFFVLYKTFRFHSLSCSILLTCFRRKGLQNLL